MTAKGETIAELESQVATLKSSLDETQAELTAKLTATGELEQAKAASEQELATLRESLQQLKDEHGAVNSRLEAVQEEVRDSQWNYAGISTLFSWLLLKRRIRSKLSLSSACRHKSKAWENKWRLRKRT